ncbi:MAG TPA: tetratricopeptide repeat protein [Edaphocola sp.]|nr:tetratricopeptide repeat protein [Edaphocola sp.]
MAQTARKSPGGVEEFGKGKSAIGADVALLSAETFFLKYKKPIIGAGVAILALVLGLLAYHQFVKLPKEDKADKALAKVQTWFEIDSLNLVINGDGQSLSAPNILKKYSGTDAANLANYYLGISYLRTGDSKNAITYLNKFDGKGTIVSNIAYGALGDAYMDAGNVDKGIESYKKAASDEKNLSVASLYTFRAGLASERAGKLDDAKKYYKKVKEKFPMSFEASNIDKYLARLGELSID